MPIPQCLGTTSGGWRIYTPQTMTSKAKTAFIVKKGINDHFIEIRNGNVAYMRKYAYGYPHYSSQCDHSVLTVKSPKVEKTTSLQTALESLGLQQQDAKEAMHLALT